MSSTRITLGVGAEGPWENREGLIRAKHPNPAAVGGWLNETYAVQLFRHPTQPGIDHLCVSRHDKGPEIPWPDMQRIKDRLAVDGCDRWGIEAFPPALAVINNHNLRHIWVMPVGWEPPVDLRDVRV